MSSGFRIWVKSDENKKMFKFQELKVYQRNLDFVDQIYKVINTWPKNETYALCDQMRRASVSISLNIAEGSSRTKKDFNHFLTLSKGSCYECVAILEIALRNEYIDKETFNLLLNKLDEISRMLVGLKRSLNL